MIRIGPHLEIDENELQFEFVRASGPGGQNVNKVSTAVQMRYDVDASDALSPSVKSRLKKLAGSRMTTEGVLLISARKYRTQHRNRQDAIDRLVSMIQEAATPPRPRKKTRRTKGSIERRLAAKKQTGEKKRDRKPPRLG
jgi:ribosome-associated protein